VLSPAATQAGWRAGEQAITHHIAPDDLPMLAMVKRMNVLLVALLVSRCVPA
jgi:hypothetical protein